MTALRVTETVLAFPCEGERLLGVVSAPEGAPGTGDLGVVIVVGGPQVRAGSHRQFVQLARHLAAQGLPTLRFDVRGMGDSGGEQHTFEHITPDIKAAIDTLQTHCPSVRRIVLWGLCDAAAAALLYCDDTHDPRIAGLCLLNPWVRSEATLARTQVKHYYGQRLLQKAFWAKLLSGRLNVARSLTELLRKLGQASAKANAGQHLSFQDRMARGLKEFGGPVQLILSGDDYTAKEFLEYAAINVHWHGLLDRPDLMRLDIPGTDHTFSSQEWRKTVENACIDWLKRYD